MVSNYHTSVLLKESVDALDIKANGTYVDATFGGGGHSRAILKELKNGTLYAFDQDDDALKNAEVNKHLVLVNHNFKYLKRFLHYYNAIPVQGILADLGVSSYQINEPQKGFSFRYDGPLDMRMNTSSSLKASDILNTYKREDLIEIFSKYGEIRNSKTLALAIVNERNKGLLFSDIQPFISFLDAYVMGANKSRYYAQVFQALRIAVNDELGALKQFLKQSYNVLDTNGVLAVITFHSLEDRVVKKFMNTGNFEGKINIDMYGNRASKFKVITKKPIVANAEELKNNNRARSAKLRVAKKI